MSVEVIEEGELRVMFKMINPVSSPELKRKTKDDEERSAGMIRNRCVTCKRDSYTEAGTEGVIFIILHDNLKLIAR